MPYICQGGRLHSARKHTQRPLAGTDANTRPHLTTRYQATVIHLKVEYFPPPSPPPKLYTIIPPLVSFLLSLQTESLTTRPGLYAGESFHFDTEEHSDRFGNNLQKLRLVSRKILKSHVFC